jgi:heterodisulfide reductase subunit A
VQDGLVIGGGLSGMTAALSLADQGFKVALVEKSGTLGGRMLNVHSVLEGDDPYFFTANMLYRTQNHRNITVYLNSEMTKVSGHIGKFTVTVSGRGKGDGRGENTKTDISCGAIIAATGAEPAKAAGFLYGESENILTHNEL